MRLWRSLQAAKAAMWDTDAANQGIKDEAERASKAALARQQVR